MMVFLLEYTFLFWTFLNTTGATFVVTARTGSILGLCLDNETASTTKDCFLTSVPRSCEILWQSRHHSLFAHVILIFTDGTERNGCAGEVKEVASIPARNSKLKLDMYAVTHMVKKCLAVLRNPKFTFSC